MDELSVKDAARALGVHADTVRRWISDGKIVAKKRGKGRGQYHIPASAIDTFRTTQDIIVQTHEIDVTGLTNEIYEQREAVVKLFDRIGDMHLNDIETAEQVRDINKKLEKVTAKIDELSSKLELQNECAVSKKAKYREYWWQFWRPESPTE
jgi:excisionase family DNA binding protein